MAFLPKPKVLVLDEPTTGLDVTTQAMVLETMAELCRTHGVSALYVTHDLAVVANIADRVAVMYAGQIVEQASASALFARPEHPYTEALLGALPQLEDHASRVERLTAIPGRPPSLIEPPVGCRFAARCPYAGVPDGCAEHPPELRELRRGHFVRSEHHASERARPREGVSA
jgi:peptide/nickel transport system ATP-binding protein